MTLYGGPAGALLGFLYIWLGAVVGVWWEERHGRGGNGSTIARLMYTFNGKVVAQREVHPDQQSIPSGSTLRGDYYHDDNLSNFFLTRYENTGVVLDASDPWPSLPAGSSGGDGFSVEWTGYITASSALTGTGLYSFSTVSEGGVRLWVSGTLLIDNWAPPHSLITDTAVMTSVLMAGQAYPIRLEYTHYTGSATQPHIELQWQPPLNAAPVTVPKSNLAPPPLTNPTDLLYLPGPVGCFARR